MYCSKLLETLFVLLSSPLTVTEPDIFSAVRDVINQLISSQIGLLFISGNVETVNCIIRSLIQSSVSLFQVKFTRFRKIMAFQLFDQKIVVYRTHCVPNERGDFIGVPQTIRFQA